MVIAALYDIPRYHFQGASDWLILASNRWSNVDWVFTLNDQSSIWNGVDSTLLWTQKMRWSDLIIRKHVVLYFVFRQKDVTSFDLKNIFWLIKNFCMINIFPRIDYYCKNLYFLRIDITNQYYNLLRCAIIFVKFTIYKRNEFVFVEMDWTLWSNMRQICYNNFSIIGWYWLVSQ